MLKKLTLSALAIIMILGVAATAGEKVPVFGYIAHKRTDVWNNYSILSFEAAAREKGVETVIIDPESNMEKAVASMEDLITQKVDGIAVYTITPDLDIRLARMANAAGIPIAFENSLPTPGYEDLYISCVACRYEDIGYAAGRYIGQNWPKAKIFYCMGQPGMNITEPYEEGFHRGLKEEGIFENLVATQPTDWGTESAMNVTQNLIQSGVEFEVIFANNEQMAQGCLNALRDAGLAGKVKIVSTGGGPDGLQMVRDGLLDATMSAPVSVQGTLSFRNLWRTYRGIPVTEKFQPLPIVPVNKDNIDSAVSWEFSPAVVKLIGGLD